MVKKKLLPIGVDDFRKIRESKKASYYVDKTLMIEDFLDYGNFVTLTTRPRRFGKTLNMTMIRDFFDITQDSRGIFEGLAIMDTEYASEINSAPVVSLSLKGCTGKTLEDLLASIASEVRKEYVKYEDILKDVDKEKSVYALYFRTLKQLMNGDISDEDLKHSLAYLLEALYTFYNVNPILLIDEYDNPIIEAHQQGFRKEFTNFYGSFLTLVLKGNPHLGQALLTGIQRVAKESIFSKLNNIVVYNVLDSHYANHFGFTEDETSKLLKHYDLELTEEVKRRYNGYNFSGYAIYNPWSILSYANKKKLQNYWLKTSTNALITESVLEADEDFHRKFETLIKDGEVDVALNLEASFAELPRADTLWGLFVNAGYLTVTNEDYVFNSFVIRIPNEEIKTEFQEIVGAYTKLASQLLKDMLRALVLGKLTEFMAIYERLVIQSTSYHDAKENAYHMLLLGMMMNLRDLYKITSNIESGYGRSDIMMESLDTKRPHIIIEFKQGEDVEKLKVEALAQIKEKQYYRGLTGEVLCIGLAHHKKVCQLVHESIIV
ncbi:MAG: ATP-binding protein [Defluviitaleaceae bacterium]|nr:ATP-binding protein [Defluviitaleaceae bacterium]